MLQKVYVESVYEMPRERQSSHMDVSWFWRPVLRRQLPYSAAEVAPSGCTVGRLNSIGRTLHIEVISAAAPGFTATKAIRSAPQWPQLEAAALKRIRATRVGDPEDVAALVAFLLSSEGAWINGQVVNVDGGTILR
jgi:NAD(P)-dependent dehydrogenase (short-subunit alcohol dehydrogenase family)